MQLPYRAPGDPSLRRCRHKLVEFRGSASFSAGGGRGHHREVVPSERLTNLLQNHSAEAGTPRLSSRWDGLVRHDRDCHRADCVGGLAGARHEARSVRRFPSERRLVGHFYRDVSTPLVVVPQSKGRSLVVLQGLVSRSRSYVKLPEATHPGARSLLRHQRRTERTVCTLDQRCLGTSRRRNVSGLHDADVEGAALQLLLQVEIDRCDLLP